MSTFSHVIYFGERIGPEHFAIEHIAFNDEHIMLVKVDGDITVWTTAGESKCFTEESILKISGMLEGVIIEAEKLAGAAAEKEAAE